MKKLKLNQLERTALNNRELEQIKGGARYCGCGCAGPSSDDDNGWANSAGGKYSGTDQDQIYCILDEIIITP
ncbi:MAG: TIGR04149 family rSAM-modified RiPP [Bacteroidales bacterium]